MNTIGRTAASLLAGGALIVGGVAVSGTVQSAGSSREAPAAPSTNLVETVAATGSPAPLGTVLASSPIDQPGPRQVNESGDLPEGGGVVSPAVVLPPPPPADSINVTHMSASTSFPEQGQTYRLLPEVNVTMEQLGTLVGQGTLHVGMPGSQCSPLKGETLHIFKWQGGVLGAQRARGIAADVLHPGVDARRRPPVADPPDRLHHA